MKNSFIKRSFILVLVLIISILAISCNQNDKLNEENQNSSNIKQSKEALLNGVSKAICYSGFREDQQPGGVCPSYDEIKEDLLILKKNWKYLRLYDCDEHADIVLEVIEKEKLENYKMQYETTKARLEELNK